VAPSLLKLNALLLASLCCLHSPAFASDEGQKTGEEIPAAKPESELSAERLVSFFEDDRCDEVESEYRAHPGVAYPPIVLAVIGSCLKNRHEALQLFREADSKKPNNQTILLLYARTTWKTDPEESKQLWRRVRMVARDESVQRIADDYLSGVVEIEETEQVSLFGKAQSGWIYAQLGSNYTSNPDTAAISNQGTNNDSFAHVFALNSRWKKNTRWGDWGAHLDLFEQSFYSRHVSDKLIGRFDLPVTMEVGNAGAVVFTPFGANELQGNSSYHYSWGLGVMGISYRDNYRQSVQGIIYHDAYLDLITKNQGGTHFRFEYEWYLYPSWFEVSTGTFIEHVKSSSDQDDSANARIYYSHNDLGLFASFAAKLRLFEPAITVFGSTRQDTNDSSYSDNNNVQQVRRRVDYVLDIRPSVGIPIERNIRANVYFDYNRVFSNFGATDYQDYNVINRIAGVNFDFQLEWL
jgi:hypothetical protein